MLVPKGQLKSILLPLAGGAALLSGGVVVAQGAPQILGFMSDGQWSLKPVGRSGVEARALCLGTSVAPLAQIEHRGQTCRITTQEISPREVAITYDCGMGNNGYTRLRAETSKLVQVDTQGFKGNMPFHNRYEARWSGAICG
jgi:hypothetical protein